MGARVARARSVRAAFAHGLACAAATGAALGAFALAPHAPGPAEFRIGWLVTAATREQPKPPPPTIVWSTTPALPAGAVAALEKLKAAIDAAPLSQKALLTTDDGRSVALFRYAFQGSEPEPTGVTIWADWRNVDSKVVFDDMSEVDFRSNHHVALSDRRRGGRPRWCVVDLRAPTVRFDFTGRWVGPSMRISDSGRWATIGRNGELLVGRFDTASPEASLVPTAVPDVDGLRNLIWVRDGDFLVVEKEGRRLEVIDAASWAVVATLEGTLSPVETVATHAGRDACLIWTPTKGSVVLEISPSGALTLAQWPHQKDEESTVRLSPSRRFAVTQHQRSYPFVTREIRRTGDAAKSDELPEWPKVSRAANIQDIGWLVWNP